MVFPNPWITILSFVYIFLLGIGSFLVSRVIVSNYLDKFKDNNFLKSLEPIIGSIGFISSFGGGLLILYYFLTLTS